MKTVSAFIRPAVCLAMPALLLTLAAISTGPALATDADSDGIPADWEELRGSSDSDPADAELDWDKDGLTTFQEYLTQGRPWGNYTFHPLVWTDLPNDLSTSSITWTEPLAGNRSGEFVFTFHGTTSRTFLWNPQASTAAARLIEVPFQEGPVIPFNDEAETVFWNTSNEAEVRSMRNWSAGGTILDSGTPPVGATQYLAGIANDGSGLFLTTYTGGTGYITTAEWRDDSGSCSDLLTFDREHMGVFGAAADPLGTGWLMGADLNSGSPSVSESFAGEVISGGATLGFTFPSGVAGGHFNAAANGAAVGQVYDAASSTWKGVLVTSSSGMTAIYGGVAGSAPTLFGITDDRVLLGYSPGPAYEMFLWNDIAVPLALARPEATDLGFIGPMTGSGALFAIDVSNTSNPPQPVAWLPATSTRGDGATDEGALTDSDGDGIPNVREAAAGTSSTLADTDGDGFSDLWELISGRDPATAESSPSAGSTGLTVHSPGRHPLSRPTALP